MKTFVFCDEDAIASAALYWNVCKLGIPSLYTDDGNPDVQYIAEQLEAEWQGLAPPIFMEAKDA